MLCRLAAALDVSEAALVALTETTARAVTLLGCDDARLLRSGPSGRNAMPLAVTQGPDRLASTFAQICLSVPNRWLGRDWANCRPRQSCAFWLPAGAISRPSGGERLA